MVGETIVHYRILSKLGEGGMGEVFKAVDTRINRAVAVKIMKADCHEQFRREAAAISALNHPNIATLYDVGQHNGSPFLVMEFIEGETLRDRLSAGFLPEQEAVELGSQILSALEHAHEHGVVHRDLKPGNIIVTPKGEAKVLDFGLAKLVRQVSETDSTRSATDSHGMAGTLQYLTPEQLRGEQVDARTDIHAMGVVLYEMVTGKHPYPGATAPLVIDAILNREPTPPRELNCLVSERLEGIILNCLKKNPKERYQGAADARRELRQGKAQLRYAARAFKTLRGRSLLLAAGLVFAVILPVALWLASPARALTEKDVVLIADFENRTGDPSFDGALLKDALTFKLVESPYLNVYPAEEVRDTLRFMGRAPDSAVDEETAREICIRQGLKALVAGSIAPLGKNYIIQLKAVEAESLRPLAMAEAEAESREEVVRQLGRAAAELRRKTGETFGASRRFDVPLEQATTASLDALRAFSTASQLKDKGQFMDALAHYKRATETDPNFALAYVNLGNMYGNADRRGMMREAVTRAYSLRERVSERERLIIEVRYYDVVVEDLHRTIAAEKLLTQAYPRYALAHNNLGAHYRTVGRYEEAIVEFKEAMRLSPRMAGFGNSNLAWTHLFLNQFDEAEKSAKQALEAGFDSGSVHQVLYYLGAVRGDSAAMERSVAWFAAKPQEYLAHRWQGDFAAFSGEFKKARLSYATAAELAERRGLKERVAIETAWSALIDAQAGYCGDIPARTSRALGESRETSVLRDSAFALVRCGRLETAESLMQELTQRHPQSTYVNELLLPEFRALAQLRRGNFRQAIDLLRPLKQYERTASGLRSMYLRGVALLGVQDNLVAAAEFHKILDNRGRDALSVIYPLAYLQLGRAEAAAGNKDAERKAHEGLIGLWKNADPDVPILKESMPRGSPKTGQWGTSENRPTELIAGH